MSHASLNLTARDFDAYAPEKATSNAYSRPRLEVKQRVTTWARGVVARLWALGIAVDVHGSDEHPSLRNKKRVDCQWVFFWRDQVARDELDRLFDRSRTIADVIDDPSPYRRHAFLALRLDSSSVEICFAVHPEATVDVDNLQARLLDGDGALAHELISALSTLPEQFAVGVAPEDRVAANLATPDALGAMLERAAEGHVPLWIGWSIPRATAEAHSALLDEQLEDAIVALAPIYRLVAWSRENDRISLDRRLATAETERARVHGEVMAQNERWLAEQQEARRRSEEQARTRSEELRRATARPTSPRRVSLETLFTGPRRPSASAIGPAPKPRPAEEASVSNDSSKTHPVEVSVPAPASHELDSRHRGQATTVNELSCRREQRPLGDRDNTLREPLPLGERTDGQPDQGAVTDDRVCAQPVLPTPSAPAAIEKGTKVRVLSGAFADKVGTIGALDGRGGARVLLGLLSTRLELTELEAVADGRERPALHVSHRRPSPPPSRKAR
jgi:hypothetical protein